MVRSTKIPEKGVPEEEQTGHNRYSAIPARPFKLPNQQGSVKDPCHPGKTHHFTISYQKANKPLYINVSYKKNRSKKSYFSLDKKLILTSC